MPLDISSIKKNITHNLINVRGVRTDQKLIIIESDDWGTIRMSSKASFQRLLKKGYPVDKCPYNSNDILESNEDLEALFDTLHSVKDKNGNPAKLTAFNIVANPDFESIKESNNEMYFYEPFTETLKRYPAHDNVMKLYQDGIKGQIIMPQFHGREHLNVSRWMQGLQRKEKAILDVCEEQMFSPKISHTTGYRNEYMDALDFDYESDLVGQMNILKDGLQLFEKIWGFKSRTFVAPCYIWHKKLEPTLSSLGIRFLDGLVNQLQPEDVPGMVYKRKYHFQGQRNKFGQRYFIRNAFFEPTLNPGFDWESDCLARIETAFKWKKPAIISSHRLNYIGSLNERNRTTNLNKLKKLLKTIVNKWDDILFISSDQLVEICHN